MKNNEIKFFKYKYLGKSATTEKTTAKTTAKTTEKTTIKSSAVTSSTYMTTKYDSDGIWNQM